MDIQRAQEIAASPVMQNVTCDGVPVYIQHVDADSELARIYPLDRPEEEREVPVRSLVEPVSRMAMEVEGIACRVTNGGAT